MLPSLVQDLKSCTDDEKLDALGQLAQIMDTSYGEDAEALCEFLRVAGCVGLIAGLLGHPKAEIHQTAMLLVGNIASEAVDAQADKTKARKNMWRKQAVNARSVWANKSSLFHKTQGRAAADACAEQAVAALAAARAEHDAAERELLTSKEVLTDATFAVVTTLQAKAKAEYKVDREEETLRKLQRQPGVFGQEPLSCEIYRMEWIVHRRK